MQAVQVLAGFSLGQADILRRAIGKKKVKELGISNRHNNIRINSAGCMDRCGEGPVIVVYPEGTWYTFVDNSDLDEIIEEHLKNGRVVERLKI